VFSVFEENSLTNFLQALKKGILFEKGCQYLTLGPDFGIWISSGVRVLTFVKW